MESINQGVTNHVRASRAHLSRAIGYNCRNDVQSLLCDALEILEKVAATLKEPEIV